jgi:hypothetical protein
VIEYNVGEDPTSPIKSVVITLEGRELGGRVSEGNDAPNKLVAAIRDEIDDRISALYSEKITASFDE